MSITFSKTRVCATSVALLLCFAGCGGRGENAGDVLHRNSEIQRQASDIQHALDEVRHDTRPAPVAISDSTSLSAAPISEKLTLESVLRHAAKDSPAVRAAQHRWLGAAQKHTQAVSLPDPRVEATYFVKRNDEKYMLGITQDIPYPGKLILAGRIADKETEAARLRYEAALRDVLSDAKETYFELYYIDRARGVTGEIKKLYERYAALAVAGRESGQTKLPETFRAESQRAQLGYDLVLLEEMRAAEAERLRAFMGLSGHFEIGITEDVAEPADLSETLESLAVIAEQHNQELAAAGVEVAKAQDQVKLARSAPIPDLMIGARYTRMVESDPLDNPVGLTAGFSIPLWFPKYRAMAKEAAELEKAAQADHDALKLTTRAELAKAFFRVTNSSRLVRLYRDTLLPQSRQALQSAEELYRAKQANLASLLETTATVHNFELARLRATADFYANIARIEKLLGTAFKLQPRTPPSTILKSEDAPEQGGAQ